MAKFLERCYKYILEKISAKSLLIFLISLLTTTIISIVTLRVTLTSFLIDFINKPEVSGKLYEHLVKIKALNHLIEHKISLTPFTFTGNFRDYGRGVRFLLDPRSFDYFEITVEALLESFLEYDADIEILLKNIVLDSFTIKKNNLNFKYILTRGGLQSIVNDANEKCKKNKYYTGNESCCDLLTNFGELQLQFKIKGEPRWAISHVLDYTYKAYAYPIHFENEKSKSEESKR
jgi:hypothetical protein